MSLKITIIDYGMGNLQSVAKKLAQFKVDYKISSDAKEIEQSDKLILPGVGHFSKAIENIKQRNLYNVINEMVVEKQKPILGICLGMQLMAKSSEEGNAEGFGWFDAEVLKINVNNTLRYKVPHMGWNQVSIEKQSNLMKGIIDNSEYYFVHSFHLKPNNSEDILNYTTYESKFVSAVEKNNIFGVQYHPEKSHENGSMLIKNFIEL